MTNIPTSDTALMLPQTLPQMARAFVEAKAEMRAALEALEAAQAKLDLAFGSGSHHSRGFGIRDPHRGSEWQPKPEDVEIQWKQTAWRILVDRMELKRICSVKKAAEIDKQMEDAKNLPEITEANMLAMIQGNARDLGAFLQEAIIELFDRLRPWHHGDLGDGYKTNKIYQIGERLVLSGYVSHGYGNARFRVSYHGDRTQTLRCLDNVMHLLDGKGTVPTHAGPLVDALNGNDNNGHVETEYFEARSFKNCNLHLRFKRLDLLAQLNLRGSGAAPVLPGREQKRGQP